MIETNTGHADWVDVSSRGPDENTYIQFHPVVYMVKLNIEMTSMFPMSPGLRSRSSPGLRLWLISSAVPISYVLSKSMVRCGSTADRRAVTEQNTTCVHKPISCLYRVDTAVAVPEALAAEVLCRRRAASKTDGACERS